jgi:hypothetical protein
VCARTDGGCKHLGKFGSEKEEWVCARAQTEGASTSGNSGLGLFFLERNLLFPKKQNVKMF